MCLVINPDITEAPARTAAYKILYYMNGRLLPLHRRLTSNLVYHRGVWAESNRDSNKLTPQEKLSCEVHKGLHVYLSKEFAEDQKIYLSSLWNVKNLKLFSCEVSPKHWVADDFSGKEAVYTKIKLL